MRSSAICNTTIDVFSLREVPTAEPKTTGPFLLPISVVYVAIWPPAGEDTGKQTVVFRAFPDFPGKIMVRNDGLRIIHLIGWHFDSERHHRVYDLKEIPE